MRAVELVEHPGRRVGARQEVARLGDQVGEIEHAGAPLGGVVGLQDGVADDEQRLGRGVGARDDQALRKREQPLRLRPRTLRSGRARSVAKRAAEALRRRCGPSSPLLVARQEEVEARSPPRATASRASAIGRSACMRVARPCGCRRMPPSASASAPHSSRAPARSRRRSRGRRSASVSSGAEAEPRGADRRARRRCRRLLPPAPLRMHPAAERRRARAITASSASPICMSVACSAR